MGVNFNDAGWRAGFGVATGGLSEIGYGIAAATGNGRADSSAKVDKTTATGTPTGSLNNFGFSVMPPADPPDLTDQLVKQRRATALTSLLGSSSRSQSFLGGGSGSGSLGGGSILGGG